MARSMYTRSLVPSDASMSLRISSSDNASASKSASLRWAYSATPAMATLHHIPSRRWVDVGHGATCEKAGRCGLKCGRRDGPAEEPQSHIPSLSHGDFSRRRHEGIKWSAWGDALASKGIQTDTCDTP